MEILLIFPGFILAIIIMVIYEIKLRRPRNRVHFYVTCERCKMNYGWSYTLWLKKPVLNHEGKWVSGISSKIIAIGTDFKYYNLRLTDFCDMEDGEVREVFLNLEN